jgi:hypothetical protein
VSCRAAKPIGPRRSPTSLRPSRPTTTRCMSPACLATYLTALPLTATARRSRSGYRRLPQARLRSRCAPTWRLPSDAARTSWMSVNRERRAVITRRGHRATVLRPHRPAIRCCRRTHRLRPRPGPVWKTSRRPARGSSRRGNGPAPPRSRPSNRPGHGEVFQSDRPDTQHCRPRGRIHQRTGWVALQYLHLDLDRLLGSTAVNA